jgi:hypothetical protein
MVQIHTIQSPLAMLTRQPKLLDVAFTAHHYRRRLPFSLPLIQHFHESNNVGVATTVDRHGCRGRGHLRFLCGFEA